MAQQYVINTVAGAGLPPSGVPALSVGFPEPFSAVVDRFGNLYFNSGRRWILRVDPSGVFTRVAGLGSPGGSGDGGLAVNAQLSGPTGMAVDSVGNLYIAGAGVRKIGTDGIITKIPGVSGFALAIDHQDRLYASLGDRVVRLDSNSVLTNIAGNGVRGFSGDDGPATSAQIYDPQQMGLAFDSADNLYIADTFNLRIRKVSNGIITTVAGTGNRGYSGDGGPATAANLGLPRTIVIDSKDVLYLEDGYFPVVPAHGLRKLAGGIISPFTSQDMKLLAVDRNDAVYIYEGAVIKKIAPSGVVTPVAGNGTLASSSNGDGGPALSGNLASPTDVAADRDGNLFIAETGAHRIRKITAKGVIATVAGTGSAGLSGDGSDATRAQLSGPEGVAVDDAGNLFIADTGNGRIRKVTPGGLITTYAGGGPGLSGSRGPATGASLTSPKGVAVDKQGNSYISDLDRVSKVDIGGVLTVLASQLSGPEGLAVDLGGNVYVVESSGASVRKVTPQGNVTYAVGAGPATRNFLDGPAATTGLYSPRRLSVDPSGNLFISDAGSIRRVLVSDGRLTTIAGSVSRGLVGGDGGLAAETGIGRAAGVAVDRDGNILFVDTQDNSIRILRPITPALVSIVNGASFQLGSVAPDSYVTAKALNLATTTLSAQAPYPITLGGTTVKITDALGTERFAPLAYVSPGQVNFILPTGVALGPGTLKITSGNGTVSASPLSVSAISPGLFVLGSSGLAAANVVQVTGSDQSFQDVYEVGPDGDIVPHLIDFGPSNGRIFLVLYGTGLRGHGPDPGSVTVSVGGTLLTPLFAGANSQYPGLDQVNIEVPSTFRGTRNIGIAITVDGQKTNIGSVSFK